MAEQGRTTLKSYFETGDKPTQVQFEDLIDSVPNTSDSGVSNTEFGYLGGVTSSIQTQINSKQDELTGLTASVTELNYTSGVTSAIQTQIDSKQDELTGLTASVTELNYTDGVTSAIQTQLDAKASLSGSTFTGDINMGDNDLVNVNDAQFDGEIGIGVATPTDGGARLDIRKDGTTSGSMRISFLQALESISNFLSTDPVIFLTQTNATGSSGIHFRNDSKDFSIRFDENGNLLFEDDEVLKFKITSSGVQVGAYTLPLTDGTNGQFLKTDGAGNVTWQIESVEADTTPRLGGDLDVNGNDIIGNPAIDGRRAIVTEAETAKTLALTDAGDFVVTTSDSATTVSIPRNATVAFPTGTEIDFIQKGAGELTIQAAGAAITLNGVSAGSTAITAQWGGATIKKIATDEWIIVGKINDVA